MIKVLHLLPMNKLSGAERMALLICKHMSEVESYVLTGGSNLAEVFNEEGVSASYLNFSIKQLPKVTGQLKHFIKEKQIDIIHAHDNIASLSAYLTKQRYRLKVQIVSHIHNCYPWLESYGIYKCLDHFIRPKYAFNIACGQIVYDYYQKNASYFNSKKTSILSNAIDINTLGRTSSKQLDDMRITFNIPKDTIVIGYIGRLTEQKGMIPFIRALKNYKNQFKNCKFLIVGSGEQEQDIKHLVKEVGVEDLFIFTGFQSNVYSFYQLIDIFFLPSLYEGLPMVLLEAIGSGVPTISMNVGSISEVIETEKSGILIEKGDYSTFIQELINLKDNSSILNIYKQNGIKKITSDFDIKEYTYRLNSIYSQLIK